MFLYASVINVVAEFIVLIPEVKLSVFKAENWETW
jgi:hypothetical protein